MAKHHGYDWLIGPGPRARHRDAFLVATELFGNGHSSSPSNTPEPFHGPRFPVTTIRDNVEAVHRLLTDDLKVTHLRAVIGFSMGARAGVSVGGEPPRFRRPHRRDVRARRRRTATASCGSKGRSPRSPPIRRGKAATTRRRRAKGLEAFGMVWAGWLYSQEWWRQELWRTNAPAGTTLEQYMAELPRTFFQRRRERLHPAGAHLAASRRRHDAGLRRRRREGAAIDQGAACSTCRRRRICISRSATRATRQRSSRG